VSAPRVGCRTAAAGASRELDPDRDPKRRVGAFLGCWCSRAILLCHTAPLPSLLPPVKNVCAAAVLPPLPANTPNGPKASAEANKAGHDKALLDLADVQARRDPDPRAVCPGRLRAVPAPP
jgi:hypothetical protein